MPTPAATSPTHARRSVLLAGAAGGATALLPGIATAATATRRLKVTARARLRAGSGANTHFWLDPSVYTVDRVPNAAILRAIGDLGIGYIRERWWPGDPGQRAAFESLSRSLYDEVVRYPWQGGHPWCSCSA